MARPSIVLAALATLVAGTAVLAQIEGAGRGVAPVDGGGAFEVSGVAVDVSGRTADAARLGGWRLAQRRAWVQLSRRLGGGGTLLSDAALDQLVSGIVVEREQIGPTRYIARLGVLFDRNRAGAILGIAPDAGRSPPMLVMPLQWSAGVGQVFEGRSDWQQAWARFRTGNSSIDYVRPAGTGADPLILNLGQAERPGRTWWRRIIDQYGAADVLVPVVRLHRQWPGGPVIGVFEARHGPDDATIGRFTLRVGSADGLPQLLDAGVARIDALYQQAQRQGLLGSDPSLSPPPDPTPTPAAIPEEELLGTGESGAVAVSGGATTTTLTIQYDTPGSTSVANTESLVRTIPGVRSAATSSLALGGVSLMRVVVEGDPAAFQRALEERGYQVGSAGTTLRIRRADPAPAPGSAG